jgi:hypothetical protein
MVEFVLRAPEKNTCILCEIGLTKGHLNMWNGRCLASICEISLAGTNDDSRAFLKSRLFGVSDWWGMSEKGIIGIVISISIFIVYIRLEETELIISPVDLGRGINSTSCNSLYW